MEWVIHNYHWNEPNGRAACYICLIVDWFFDMNTQKLSRNSTPDAGLMCIWCPTFSDILNVKLQCFLVLNATEDYFVFFFFGLSEKTEHSVSETATVERKALESNVEAFIEFGK